MVKTYSLKEHGKSHKLSPNFTLGEFACNDGSDEVLVSEELVNLLEEIRAWARLKVAKDARVIVTSGYRTKRYNQKVGGAQDSQHTHGTAADIQIIGFGNARIEPYVAYTALDAGEVSEWEGGLGLYDSWIHVDTRGKKARWKG